MALKGLNLHDPIQGDERALDYVLSKNCLVCAEALMPVLLSAAAGGQYDALRQLRQAVAQLPAQSSLFLRAAVELDSKQGPSARLFAKWNKKAQQFALSDGFRGDAEAHRLECACRRDPNCN